MAYFNPAMISQFASLAQMTGREAPVYRRGVAQMTKTPSQDFLLPEDAKAIRKNEEVSSANREALRSKQPGSSPKLSMMTPIGKEMPLAASAPASTQPSFLSQVGDAYNKIAPDLFRGIAAGLASYKGDPMRPYSGVGEAMAATMQRSEQTREDRRQMGLAEEVGTAKAKVVAAAEREMNRQNMGDFRGMSKPSADDRRYFDDLAKMEGFKIGVPSDSVNKAMLAYTAANPFSATERDRMEADMRKSLQSALRISF